MRLKITNILFQIEAFKPKYKNPLICSKNSKTKKWGPNHGGPWKVAPSDFLIKNAVAIRNCFQAQQTHIFEAIFLVKNAYFKGLC